MSGYTAGRLAMLVLVTVLAAIGLPRLHALVFAVDAAPTHLFYSPVEKAFVFREHRGGHDFTYGDQHGATFDRRAFETRIPFIYYKNMDLWGLLPLTIDGRSFDLQTIRDERQVLELKAREIADRRPGIAVYPLIESNPGRARLRFPEDVFRMTPDAMEFLNVDTNTVDPALTARFTGALLAAGFTFPARLVAGRPTILKPFDDGYLMVDAEGVVFHVRRVDGEPVVVRTAVPTDLDIRHIKVIESQRREVRALVLGHDDRLWLMRYDDYGLVPLPTRGYDPDRMDYKILLNPIHATAVYGDGEMTHAVAMGLDFVPLADYTRPTPPPVRVPGAWLADAAAPVSLDLADPDGTYLVWTARGHGLLGLAGVAFAYAGLVLLARRRRVGLRRMLPAFLLALPFGAYALLAACVVPDGRRRRA